mmetsp:Transcript_34397/g.99080  ORF Transcript_34397/g.99080 Transcript_34397/m.99080 type:complete len:227 (+) Transcript_34397:170-850(+)
MHSCMTAKERSVHRDDSHYRRHHMSADVASLTAGISHASLRITWRARAAAGLFLASSQSRLLQSEMPVDPSPYLTILMCAAKRSDGLWPHKKTYRDGRPSRLVQSTIFCRPHTGAGSVISAAMRAHAADDRRCSTCATQRDPCSAIRAMIIPRKVRYTNVPSVHGGYEITVPVFRPSHSLPSAVRVSIMSWPNRWLNRMYCRRLAGRLSSTALLPTVPRRTAPVES